ncbi:MAG: DUF2846 domain-containing protein [Vitreimonas sp.]
MRLTRRHAIAVLLASAASTGKALASNAPFTPVINQSADEAIIYVYRSSHMIGAVASFHFKLDDGDTEYSLGNGRYLILRVPSGAHVLRQVAGHGAFSTAMVDLHLPDVTVNVEAGQHYYVEFSMTGRVTRFMILPGGGSTSNIDSSEQFGEVPEEQALPEIARTHLAG